MVLVAMLHVLLSLWCAASALLSGVSGAPSSSRVPSIKDDTTCIHQESMSLGGRAWRDLSYSSHRMLQNDIVSICRYRLIDCFVSEVRDFPFRGGGQLRITFKNCSNSWHSPHPHHARCSKYWIFSEPQEGSPKHFRQRVMQDFRMMSS